MTVPLAPLGGVLVVKAIAGRNKDIAGIEHVAEHLSPATLDEAVAYSFQIGPAARAMAGAPESLEPALEAALREALAPFATPQGVFIPGAAFVVTARA